MLKKKYYDGSTVHDILSKHLDDGHKILELLTAFADADGVDAVPVRHGKWIWKGEDGDSRCMCSECKCKEYVPTCNGVPNIWNYCPNCGARMRDE